MYLNHRGHSMEWIHHMSRKRFVSSDNAMSHRGSQMHTRKKQAGCTFREIVQWNRDAGHFHDIGTARQPIPWPQEQQAQLQPQLLQQPLPWLQAQQQRQH